MKTAEFTDYASAQAFLAAGRKKGERSTSDGWNTVLTQDGADFVLKLHGAEIVRYATGFTTINIPMRNHVVADRIQRYGFADRLQLVTGPRAWSLSQKWGEMVGINENPSIWYPSIADVPSVVTLDATGGLVVPTSPPMPGVLSALDRARIFEPAIKKWLTAAMKIIDKGWEFTEAEWKACPECMQREMNPGQPMLAWFASQRHLFSHVLEGIVLPATVVGLVAQAGSTRALDFTSLATGEGRMGGSGTTYNHDAVRRYLKNYLRHATR